jgi:integrase
MNAALLEDMHIHNLLDSLRAERIKLQAARLSVNTRKGYGYDWAMFKTWCERLGRPSLPATSETLSLYLADILSAGRKVSTATRRAAAVAHYHRQAGLINPMNPDVRGLLTAAQRMRGEQTRQMRALTLEQLHAIAELLTQDATQQSIMDRELLVLGFASALRRSNLVALDLSHVEFSGGNLILHIGREKQDQSGRGRLIGVPAGHDVTCPVFCTREWLKIRGTAAGPFFCRLDTLQALRPDYVLRAVRRGVKRLGLDPLQYGGHSLRAGFITAAGEAGAGELVIAAQSGHRSMEVLRRYFRRTDLFRVNACSMIGL